MVESACWGLVDFGFISTQTAMLDFFLYISIFLSVSSIDPNDPTSLKLAERPLRDGIGSGQTAFVVYEFFYVLFLPDDTIICNLVA